MSQRHIRAAYARLDATHLFDGLFVPTKGRKRGRLLVPQRPFGGALIGFQGFEQLGSSDQSILLALTAQLGIDGLVIDAAPQGEISQQLRLDLKFSQDGGMPLASKETSLRSLLIDAGYEEPDSGPSLKQAKECLNRLANAQLREQNLNTGWDQRYNLISVRFDVGLGDKIHVAANPRLSQAVFAGQHVRISLIERAAMKTQVAKILHCWLCSNVRLGQALGRGNGARIDTLAPHVWGAEGWEVASRSMKSRYRAQLRDALDEIRDATKRLGGSYEWAIDRTSDLVMVSRPKMLPIAEFFELLPSDMAMRK